MRSLILIVFCVLIPISSGCSGNSTLPNVPDDNLNISDQANQEIQILASGTLNLEDGSFTESNRSADQYYDVTSYVGSSFSYTIDGVIPPDILDITLTIDNTSALTVHDVCIVFEDLFGKTVMNPDSYMDIFRAWDIDPFIAFRKEDPIREFPPGPDSEQLLLKYPGGNPNVDFFIIAHLGGNTGGVYEIGNWNVSGQLTPSGGNANITVDALDHQLDVSSVTADTSVITGDITDFTLLSNDTWEADITNAAGAPVGTYIIPVMAASTAQPLYQTYNFFEISVINDGDVFINSLNFVEKPIDDTWHDICVTAGGPVYICADHTATGNIDDFRTTIRMNNDLTNLEVINPGIGMNDPDQLGVEQFWNRIDITDGGYLVTNPGFTTIITWEIIGTDAIPTYASNSLSCSTGWRGNLGFFDVWHQTESQWDSNGLGWTETTDCPTTNWAAILKRPDGGDHGSLGGLSIPSIYDWFSLVAAEGIDGTENCIFFISDGTDGRLSLSGPWLPTESTDGVEIDSVGSLGTGDAEFTGGLDVAIDSTGKIVTLEDHGAGVFRFQKFNPDLTWIYSSAWIDNGNPMRIDFDRITDNLYLLSSTGVHIMAVQ